MNEQARQKCNVLRDGSSTSITLCPDMAMMLSPDNVGDIFKIASIEGSAVITARDGAVLMYCPFCGEKIGEGAIPKNRFVSVDWRAL